MSLPVPLSILLEAPGRGVRRITAEARDVSFREVVPGGFASARVPLHRPLAIAPNEIAYYSRLAISDARNGSIVFDGRLEDPALSAGPDGEVWELAAVGPSAHASDRTVPLAYVDRDLTSLTRASNLLPGGTNAVTADPGGSSSPVLLLQFPTGLVIATNDRVTMRYNRIRYAGQKLARVSYGWGAGVTDANQQTEAIASTGAVSTGDTVSSVNWNTAGGSVAGVVGTNWTAGRDTLNLRINRSAAAAAVPNDTFWSAISSLAIRAMLKDAIGNDITTGYTLNTVYAHEVVTDLLGRLLTKYDGTSASIAPTSYAITQLTYPDGVTAHKVLEDLMLFEPDFYWAAWERLPSGKHRFEWKAWPTNIRYEADITDGYDSAGSGDGLYDAVTVRWKDVNGEIRTNRRTQTVPELTAAGITRDAFIDLGDEVGSSANADRAGDQFLIQHLTPPNAGRLTFARPIQDHVLGRMVMPWEIRAGHLIRVRGIRPRVDALNTSSRDGVTVFRITAKDYAVSRAAATLELDSYPLSVSHALAKVLQAKPMRRR